MTSLIGRFGRWCRSGPPVRRFVFFLPFVAAGLVIGFSPIPVWAFLIFLAVFIAWSIAQLKTYAHEAGYWQAQVEMYASLEEAQARGLTLEEWLAGHMERTSMRAAFGLPSARTQRLLRRRPSGS